MTKFREDEESEGVRVEERKREEEKEGNETVKAKRRSVSSNSGEAFDIFSQGEDLERCGGFSWSDLLDNLDDLSDCELESRTDVPAVLDVTDVLVSPFSVVIEFWEGFSCCSEWEIVEPQSFPLSRKRSIVWEEKHEEMSCKRNASKSATDDVDHATAKFAFVDRSNAVASGDRGTRKYLECSRKDGNRKNGQLPGQK